MEAPVTSTITISFATRLVAISALSDWVTTARRDLQLYIESTAPEHLNADWIAQRRFLIDCVQHDLENIKHA